MRARHGRLRFAFAPPAQNAAATNAEHRLRRTAGRRRAGDGVASRPAWRMSTPCRPEAGHESRRRRLPGRRSEEHTSELQSLMRISYAVFCLKKKNIKQNKTVNI